MEKLPKLRGMKNLGDLTKEDLFYTFLRSEESLQEDLYLKYINNATNSNIKERINHIRMVMAKLGNMIAGKERKAIREELFKLRNTKLTKTTREKAVTRLVELTNDLYNKQKSHHDQTYYGIKNLEHLFNTIDPNNYYKPIIVRSSFENNFKEHEIRGDKHKNVMLKEYLTKITPQLAKLIDELKNSAQDKQKFN